jgi:hypothetical protein
MSLIDWFRSRTYTLTTQTCSGCAAHRMHIEDLQSLLKSERESYGALQTILLQKFGIAQPTEGPSQVSEDEVKPLRKFNTMSQLRREATAKEKLLHPNATSEYWTKVQEEYDRAGKLPDTGE